MPNSIRQTLARAFAPNRHMGFAFALSLTYALAAPSMVHAQEEAGLSLELNRAAQTKTGCMLTFVATNKAKASLNGVAYELVLFNKDGLVEQMTAFDFGALPNGKTVVRQFELPNRQCESLGQILINGASRCDVADPQPGLEDICISALQPKTRADIDFLK
ncbi:hypothetical protein [Roseibium limicola]|uniref:Tat pathway signal sequence domain protein n=1 Tax=Roseibium limicola TaxID=2816037 RepID=A0A939J8Q8_9HYPH|nr:hypothetical protein [Roseibium limicola]MBO0344603.1 hypothetical protein [Roseibium limicola]